MSVSPTMRPVSFHRAGPLTADPARIVLEEFARLRPGPVELRGRVVVIDPLVSDETGRRGVYLHFTADRWGRTTDIGPSSGGWFRADEQEEAAPFELTDGETSVLVDPNGAAFVPGRHKSRSVVLTRPGGVRVRYTERMVEEGDEVVVVGNAVQQGGHESSAPYRGHTHRWVIEGLPHEPLVVAGAAPVVRKLTRGLSVAGIVTALAALVGGVYLLVGG